MWEGSSLASAAEAEDAEGPFFLHQIIRGARSGGGGLAVKEGPVFGQLSSWPTQYLYYVKLGMVIKVRNGLRAA